jgi:hypothetical protein
MILITIMMIINRTISNKNKQIRIIEFLFMDKFNLTDTIFQHYVLNIRGITITINNGVASYTICKIYGTKQ